MTFVKPGLLVISCPMSSRLDTIFLLNDDLGIIASRRTDNLVNFNWWSYSFYSMLKMIHMPSSKIQMNEWKHKHDPPKHFIFVNLIHSFYIWSCVLMLPLSKSFTSIDMFSVIVCLVLKVADAVLDLPLLRMNFLLKPCTIFTQ